MKTLMLFRFHCNYGELEIVYKTVATLSYNIALFELKIYCSTALSSIMPVFQKYWFMSGISG